MIAVVSLEPLPSAAPLDSGAGFELVFVDEGGMESAGMSSPKRFVALVSGYGDQLGAGAYVGGWYSPERDVYLIEISELHRVDRAHAVARSGWPAGQEAILDMATGEMIPTGGRGDAPPR